MQHFPPFSLSFNPPFPSFSNFSISFYTSPLSVFHSLLRYGYSSLKHTVCVCEILCLCSVYISCGWVAKASAVTGCQCDLWAHHTLSEPASHTDAHTYTADGHLNTNTHTHAHISCDGQSYFIKLTPDQSQMHWRRTKTLSHHSHTHSFVQCITSTQTSEWRRILQRREKGKKSQPLKLRLFYSSSFLRCLPWLILFSWYVKDLLEYKLIRTFLSHRVCFMAAWRSRAIYLAAFTASLSNISILKHCFSAVNASTRLIRIAENVFSTRSNEPGLLSGLRHISSMQLCRKAYSPKSMCVCALNRHTSSLSRSACMCDSVTSVCTCLVVTGQQTWKVGQQQREGGARKSDSDTLSTCESTATGLVWSRSSWLTAVGKELGERRGVLVVGPLGEGNEGEEEEEEDEGEKSRMCLLMHLS